MIHKTISYFNSTQVAYCRGKYICQIFEDHTVLLIGLLHDKVIPDGEIRHVLS